MIPTDLSSLPAALAERVRRCVEAVTRGAGEQLASVALVTRRDGRAADLVLVLRSAHVATLANIGHQVQGLVGGDLALRVLTERELLRAADVFALELADYRARATIVHGEAPFSELYSTAGELRLALERALRTLARSLRDSLAMGEVRDVADDIDRLDTIARHWVAGDAPPAHDEAIEKALAAAGIDARPVVALRDALREGRAIDPAAAIGDLLEAVDALTGKVDAHGAG